MKRRNKPLVIGLKYCGGCKPNYDRVALVEHIRKRIAPLACLVPSGSEFLDAVLVVQGCPTACADVAAFGNIPIFTITAPEDVDRFIDFLSTSFNERKDDVAVTPRDSRRHVSMDSGLGQI